MSILRTAFAGALLLSAALPANAQSGIAVPPIAGLAPETTGDRLEVWQGFTHTGTFNGGGIAVIAAVNQRDMWTSGMMFRAEAFVGRYQPSVLTHTGTMMFGYRHDTGTSFITTYVGTTYETHESPSSFPLHGTRGGVKFLAEYHGDRVGSLELYASASYATMYDTVTGYAKLSHWTTDRLRIGPEAAYFRHEAYRDYKVGGFVGVVTPFPGEFTISGGYIGSLTSGAKDGYYVTVGLSVRR